jgi:hypothetical protein
MFKQGSNNAINQRPQQPRSLQPGNLLLLKGMLYIRLDARQMTPESANGRLAGNHSALFGNAGESVGKERRRSFRGTW